MAKMGFLSFLREQWATAPPVVNVDLQGKTIVVIGANTGLGFEAVKHFARMKVGRLILACRSREKGEAAILSLKEATGYSKAELWLVDLAEFASVKAFADRALKDLERLDVLLLNAGMALANSEYKATTDGWEQTLQVNDLSLSLLTILLLPRLLETAKQCRTTPRVVLVTSVAHYRAEIEDKVLDSPNAFDVLGSKEYCTPKILKARYPDSKLLNLFFVRALNNHLYNQPVIVNAVHPGLCNSGMIKGKPLVQLLSRPVEEGSRQLVWAAVGVPPGGGNSLDKLRGAYISLADIHEPSDFVLGEQGKRREEKLWDDLIDVLERVDSRVNDVVLQYLSA